MITRNKLCFIDTETGGLDPERHPILTVTFGIEVDGNGPDAEFKCNTFKFRYDSVINSNFALQEDALKVNGLTREEIAKFPTKQASMQNMHSYLSTLNLLYGKLTPVGHNYVFDLGFLNQVMDSKYGAYFDRRYIDTMIAAKFIDGALDLSGMDNKYFDNLSLQGLCSDLGIKVGEGEAHTSEGDVIATRKLFYALCEIVTSEQDD